MRRIAPALSLTSGLIALGTACYTPYVPPDSGDTGTDPAACSADPTSGTHDADGDLLSDADEAARGTDPCVRDSDGDGVSDGVEVQLGGDPTNGNYHGDGEVIEIADGADGSLELSFTVSIDRADVAFLIDTTGSMGALANAMAAEFSAIVSEVSTAVPDASYGVATFDDYAYGGFGSTGDGDRPFILRQQQTTDIARVQAALSDDVVLHFGGDGPESAIEALFQAVTGAGYDQGGRCGSFDAAYDVQPFHASAGDPFGGAAGGAYDPTVPGTGIGGGMGFRRGALPVVVYATDAELRDPDGGYGVPPACGAFTAASSAAVVAALQPSGGRLVGVNVATSGGPGRAAMESLAWATNSVGDLDGNGIDEPFVVNWDGSSSAAFRTTVVNALRDLVGAITFSTVELAYDGAGTPFVASVAPASYTQVNAATFSTPLTFTVFLRGAVPAAAQDQVFPLHLTLLGDGSVALGQRNLTIVVPGTGA